MFKFLKDKLKNALGKFSKKVEEEGEEEVVEQQLEIPAEKLLETEIVEPKKEQREEPEEEAEEIIEAEAVEVTKPEPVAEPEKPKIKEHEKTAEIQHEAEKPEVPEPIVENVKLEKVEAAVGKIKKEIPLTRPAEEAEKKGLFRRITEKISTKKLSEKQFEEIFWELEVVLLENNVAVGVIDKIKHDLKEELVDQTIPRKQIEKTIESRLKQSIQELFDTAGLNIMEKLKEKKPLVIAFVGVNGSGKTTTIAKVANMLKENGKNVVIAAADTFRAAAIDQLQMHADKLGVKLIKHDYGSDAAAVVYDAVEHAKAKNADVVLIDTAGRLHSNVNLMDEMKKIIRIGKPDLKIFVGESITGNDCIEQAQKFDEAIGLDGIILSKADVDEKGGTALSISYVTKKPILYLGVGQEYKDLQAFSPQIIINNLGLA